MGGNKSLEAPADANEVKIPPLNPEDPPLGLTNEKVQQSRDLFGKNEVGISCRELR